MVVQKTRFLENNPKIYSIMFVADALTKHPDKDVNLKELWMKEFNDFLSI